MKLSLPTFVVCLSLIASACAREEPPRHAVVILVDTLRADALDHADTPVLDALAARGEQVERAWSLGTWTAPSLVSLFTGMHVREHGWDFGFRGSRRNRATAFPLLPDVPTLGLVLRRAGFETAGIFASRVLAWDLGFERGFARWRRSRDPQIPRLVRQEVASWRPGERHFLYVHLMGPHQPLRPSTEAAARWQIAEDLEAHPLGMSLHWARKLSPAQWITGVDLYRKAYWAVVEDTDARIGEILEALGPHLDDSLVVVTSDHGEMMGERFRFGHRRWLDEPLTRIPLIAAGAGPLPDRLTLAAVPDLVTRALGVEHPWSVRVDGGGPLVSQRQGALALSPEGRFKAVWHRNGSQGDVYDLEREPLEPQNRPEQVPDLEAQRRAFQERVPVGISEKGKVRSGPEIEAALRELGYVE